MNRPNPSDIGFGFIEDEALRPADKGDMLAIFLGCLALAVSVPLVFGPAFLALTRMF